MGWKKKKEKKWAKFVQFVNGAVGGWEIYMYMAHDNTAKTRGINVLQTSRVRYQQQK